MAQTYYHLFKVPSKSFASALNYLHSKFGEQCDRKFEMCWQLREEAKADSDALITITHYAVYSMTFPKWIVDDMKRLGGLYCGPHVWYAGELIGTL